MRLLRSGRRRELNLPPPAVLALLYLALVAVGTVVLRLPISSHDVGWLDALFTATSAVTVTGLVVVDTGSAFTLFGQATIACLIQLGGIGLMVFAALVLATLGLPIQMMQRVMLTEDLAGTSLSSLSSLLRAIAQVVIVAELIGMAALSFVFVPEFGWSYGLWCSAFHAISAFNNAGFSLFSDSLSAWVGNPVINITVPALFILGGLGFVVIDDVMVKRQWRRLTLHTKLMIVGTAALIPLGWLMIVSLEWSNAATLGGLDPGTRLWASWFMAVTPRTAGFSTIDVAGLRDTTSLGVISLMLIGGGPASTAGGVKVTTVCVLFLATYAFYKQNEQVTAFGRSLATEQVMKVMALITISTMTVMIALFVVLISHDGAFLDIAFEVVSAFGTVGLSRGATGELDALGRIVVIVLMFLGRVGPLALGVALATRVPPRVRYPQGQIFIG